MDLVDIDKALDELELHQEREKQLEDEQHNKQSQLYRLATARHNDGPPDDVRPKVPEEIIEADFRVPPRSSVSNVFQSLNEYVSSGVEDALAGQTLAKLHRYAPDDDEEEEEGFVEAEEEEEEQKLNVDNNSIGNKEPEDSAGSSGSPLLLSDASPGEPRCFVFDNASNTSSDIPSPSSSQTTSSPSSSSSSSAALSHPAPDRTSGNEYQNQVCCCCCCV